jgi:hypothetical protein
MTLQTQLAGEKSNALSAGSQWVFGVFVSGAWSWDPDQGPGQRHERGQDGVQG